MKKRFTLSALVLTMTIIGGLGNSDLANACPFARNKTTSTIQNVPNGILPLAIRNQSNMMFAIAATVGLLATGWVVASRLRASIPEVQDELESSSLSVYASPEV